MDHKQIAVGEPNAGGEQPAESVEANKPKDARAKNKPDAGNILGGVQPKPE